jgi:exopolysaccharide biosynthesis predicted pyruvyltransferase EpsI
MSYNKVDWKFVHTPGIDDELPTAIKKYLADNHHNQLASSPMYQNSLAPTKEKNRNVRAQAKAINGFEMLASAEFVITDRLHGHIMSTLLGIPHVVMDSKLGKNLAFIDTWTKDCDCVRVARNMDEALVIAERYISKRKARDPSS